MPRSLAAVCLTLCLPAAAMGIDLFVSNVAGSDRFSGRAARPQQGQGPVQTISRALQMASKGDRIVIANTGRPYRESLSVQAGRHTGLPGQPFRIEGNGSVIDGSLPVPDDSWEHVRGDIYRFRPRKLSHHQLFLDDKPLPRAAVAASLLAPFPALEPLQWCLYQGHVYFHAEENRTPRDYSLSHTVLLTGITLYEVRGVEVRDLVVQGFVFDGVNAHDSAIDVELAHLTCRGNGRSGISVGGASRVRVNACLLGSNAESQLRIRDYCRVLLQASSLFDDPLAPAIDRRGAAALVSDAGR